MCGTFVDYRTFRSAVRDIQSKRYKGPGDIHISVRPENDHTHQAYICCSSVQLMEPDQMEVYADSLKEAAQDARNFPFNGMKIRYQPVTSNCD